MGTMKKNISLDEQLPGTCCRHFAFLNSVSSIKELNHILYYNKTMATATVERVTYREGNKYPQGLGGASGAGEEAGGPVSLNEPLLSSSAPPSAPPPRPGQVC